MSRVCTIWLLVFVGGVSIIIGPIDASESPGIPAGRLRWMKYYQCRIRDRIRDGDDRQPQ